MNWRDYIISEKEVLLGKPTIKGTRISVELILDRFAAGMSEKEILQDYPHLTAKQIQAPAAYAKRIVVQKTQSGVGNRQDTPATLYTHEISR